NHHNLGTSTHHPSMLMSTDARPSTSVLYQRLAKCTPHAGTSSDNQTNRKESSNTCGMALVLVTNRFTIIDGPSITKRTARLIRLERRRASTRTTPCEKGGTGSNR
ncbi:hypothetical protein LTR16_002885, partial [Cryomyces antarcticus]